MHSHRLAAVLLAFCFLSALAAQRAAAQESPWPELRTAGPFLLDEIHQKQLGNWARVWRTLYPAHQAWAPRRTFVRCERRTQVPAELDSVQVVSVRKQHVRVAGVAKRVPGVGVTVRVTLRATREPIAFRHTFHLIPVSGRWTWILAPETYRMYHDTGCLLGPAA